MWNKWLDNVLKIVPISNLLYLMSSDRKQTKTLKNMQIRHESAMSSMLAVSTITAQKRKTIFDRNSLLLDQKYSPVEEIKEIGEDKTETPLVKELKKAFQKSENPVTGKTA
ncbi:hypothetical protein NEAUS04_2196 [Nematocida ausubeli]|uniref:Uncharacterized protein n=1 Tax=Nematocida ausubeli (strain ATCC PRA-371 / ERTm2) TaxID=1913371 RepID=A0A086J2I8_NEMA1|nr:uncharacterized protein NESG_01477 [Nematocida ausubeli]KAI5150204.1 hypothetical protein NEAUS05_2080 [Nematocida ausubeli]KAI5164199.1 hypothetical protein NEAUS04_2026 [Nematocida ausubeli]KAI5164423.1 hypothetical protein NEAUS04_2196 [Nematocida ausubeli]KFG26356.1 hypothetical protein NESG_01477 [Nematocida ausubeli]